jgi:bacillithiol biosynthesis cysteine-adding enzyme BshC
VVVATGQLVGLFLGPLYTLYKAASAIAWAKHLAKEHGVRAVPLFWLQTEDHDFAEIAAVTVPLGGTDPLLMLTLNGDPSRVSVAQRRLGTDAGQLLEDLDDAIHKEPHGAAVIALLGRHYAPGERLADAFAGTLAEIFPDLVIFDPRTAAAARAAVPVLQRAFSHAAAIDQALIDRGAALTAAGYAEQIPPRPGSSLAFWHDKSSTGPRQRLLRRGDHFSWPDLRGERKFSLEQITAQIAEDPLRVSTSALLRPIVQDTILPTALYVGGPAEVDYFGQVSALYPLFDLPPPLVAHRNRFRLLTPRSRSLLAELALQPNDLDLPAEALTAKLTKDKPPQLDEGWYRAFEAEVAKVTAPQLQRRANKARRGVHHAWARLKAQVAHRALEQDETLRTRLERLQRWLRPNGEPQERVHGFLAFAARVGIAGLRTALLEHTDPLQPASKDVSL